MMEKLQFNMDEAEDSTILSRAVFLGSKTSGPHIFSSIELTREFSSFKLSIAKNHFK